MLVISYADFFADPAQYKQAAATTGIKILPERKAKKAKRLPRRIQKKLDALDAVVGIIPEDIDVDAIKAERLARQ